MPGEIITKLYYVRLAPTGIVKLLFLFGWPAHRIVVVYCDSRARRARSLSLPQPPFAVADAAVVNAAAPAIVEATDRRRAGGITRVGNARVSIERVVGVGCHYPARIRA